MRRVRTTVSTTEPNTRKRRRKSGQREDEERAGGAEMEESWNKEAWCAKHRNAKEVPNPDLLMSEEWFLSVQNHS